MKKNTIGILICYFGNLPDYFPLWKKSCELNANFDFIVITDQNIEASKNIIVYSMSFEELKEKISNALGIKTNILTPYKLCDFKCMYGVIFFDILQEYDFWGMCDMDMIFGDLSKFITKELLTTYEKIYQLGHLTLYKNNEVVNSRYKLDGWMEWSAVATSPYHCRLCERGMMEKYKKANIPVYSKRDYADINKVHKQFQLSKWLVPNDEKINYKLQVFFWENGKVYRQYYYKHKMYFQEFAYIHFQKRKMQKIEFNINNVDSYYITKNAFIEKNTIRLSACQLFILNPYYGKFYECLECIKYEIKKRYKNLKYNKNIEKAMRKKL